MQVCRKARVQEARTLDGGSTPDRNRTLITSRGPSRRSPLTRIGLACTTAGVAAGYVWPVRCAGHKPRRPTRFGKRWESCMSAWLAWPTVARGAWHGPGWLAGWLSGRAHTDKSHTHCIAARPSGRLVRPWETVLPSRHLGTHSCDGTTLAPWLLPGRDTARVLLKSPPPPAERHLHGYTLIGCSEHVRRALLHASSRPVLPFAARLCFTTFT